MFTGEGHLGVVRCGAVLRVWPGGAPGPSHLLGGGGAGVRRRTTPAMDRTYGLFLIVTDYVECY